MAAAQAGRDLSPGDRAELMNWARSIFYGEARTFLAEVRKLQDHLDVRVHALPALVLGSSLRMEAGRAVLKDRLDSHEDRAAVRSDCQHLAEQASALQQALTEGRRGVEARGLTMLNALDLSGLPEWLRVRDGFVLRYYGGDDGPVVQAIARMGQVTEELQRLAASL